MAISNTKLPPGTLSPASQGVANSPKGATAAKSRSAEGADAKEAVSGAVAPGAASAIRSAAAGYAKQAASPSSTAAANVTISPKARELSLAKSVAENTPDVREDKVAEFKKLIASGNYNPDSGKIADGILKEAMKDELSSSPDVALE